MRKVLVTGSAGFIGYHLSQLLLDEGFAVVGYDGLTDYYDVRLKQRRHQMLMQNQHFSATVGMLEDFDTLRDLAMAERPDVIVHLAAQAGVRYSLENPHAYVESNVVAFTNILEACRHGGVGHLTYASTSSVYGADTAMPFSEHQSVDHPLQFYAATKRANELMAHSYSHLFRLPTTGLRFFTVYGPWGRPDMALFLFTRNILEGRPIPLFNGGNHTRDFTYVGDIAEGVIRTSDNPAAPNADWNSDRPDPATSNAPFRLFNIGNNSPVKLLDYVEALEEALGRKAERQLLPLQPGDVPDTFADVGELERAVGYRPATPVKEGVATFVAWYRDYYRVAADA